MYYACLTFSLCIGSLVYSMMSKVLCQDQCLLDASFYYDGNVHYSDSRMRCEIVMYASLVSAGLHFLFICVTWAALFSDNKNWLFLQNIFNICGLFGMIYICHLQLSMYNNWCFRLSVNMFGNDGSTTKSHNQTCSQALIVSV